MATTQEPGGVMEEAQWSLFRTLLLKAACHTPPLWPQFNLFQHWVKVDTSDVQSSELLFEPQSLINT